MKLAHRMKRYESASHVHLTNRMPVIVRIDGRAFHTLTKQFVKPFDKDLEAALEYVAITLCREIPNVKFAYGQSDEINLLLVDYDNHNTAQVFDGDVQKIASVLAARATSAFIHYFHTMTFGLLDKAIDDIRPSLNKYNANGWSVTHSTSSKELQYVFTTLDIHKKYMNMVSNVSFDARAFNVPREDVFNYFLWRVRDAINNGIQVVGQKYFTPKELHGLNKDQVLLKCVAYLKSQNQDFYNLYKPRNLSGFLVTKAMGVVWTTHTPGDIAKYLQQHIPGMVNPSESSLTKHGGQIQTTRVRRLGKSYSATPNIYTQRPQ